MDYESDGEGQDLCDANVDDAADTSINKYACAQTDLTAEALQKVFSDLVGR